MCYNPPCCCMFTQEGEEFLAREAKRSKADEEAAEGEKDPEVAAEAWKLHQSIALHKMLLYI